MKHSRNVITIALAGCSAAFGCAFETSPDFEVEMRSSVLHGTAAPAPMNADTSEAQREQAEVATYWYEQGLALFDRARAGDTDAYARSISPFRKCIEVDPRQMRCNHLLLAALRASTPSVLTKGQLPAVEHRRLDALTYPPPHADLPVASGTVTAPAVD